MTGQPFGVPQLVQAWIERERYNGQDHEVARYAQRRAAALELAFTVKDPALLRDAWAIMLASIIRTAARLQGPFEGWYEMPQDLAEFTSAHGEAATRAAHEYAAALCDLAAALTVRVYAIPTGRLIHREDVQILSGWDPDEPAPDPDELF